MRCCKAWDIHPVFEHVFFLRFRYSFCCTSHLSPFPFSATTQVMENHTRYRRSSPGGQLYFVCNKCWTYSRHVAVLHEPCWGCHILESVGWEFWTPGRGRSAWWRHPCWMFILIFFIRNPLDYWPCNDFSRLAHPSSTLYRSSLDSHWILQDITIFRSWPIPHKLCIVNHQGWSSFLYLFKLKRWFFIRMSLDPGSFQMVQLIPMVPTKTLIFLH